MAKPVLSPPSSPRVPSDLELVASGAALEIVPSGAGAALAVGKAVPIDEEEEEEEEARHHDVEGAHIVYTFQKRTMMVGSRGCCWFPWHVRIRPC
jgi:hypothetical protein